MTKINYKAQTVKTVWYMNKIYSILCYNVVYALPHEMLYAILNIVVFPLDTNDVFINKNRI